MNLNTFQPHPCARVWKVCNPHQCSAEPEKEFGWNWRLWNAKCQCWAKQLAMLLHVGHLLLRSQKTNWSGGIWEIHSSGYFPIHLSFKKEVNCGSHKGGAGPSSSFLSHNPLLFFTSWFAPFDPQYNIVSPIFTFLGWFWTLRPKSHFIFGRNKTSSSLISQRIPSACMTLVGGPLTDGNNDTWWSGPQNVRSEEGHVRVEGRWQRKQPLSASFSILLIFTFLSQCWSILIQSHGVNIAWTFLFPPSSSFPNLLFVVSWKSSLHLN